MSNRRRKPLPKPTNPGDPSETPLRWWLRNRGEIDAAVDRDVERSCNAKAAYASEAEARAHAAMNDMSGLLFTYHCRYCDMWHLTRRPT